MTEPRETGSPNERTRRRSALPVGQLAGVAHQEVILPESGSRLRGRRDRPAIAMRTTVDRVFRRVAGLEHEGTARGDWL